MSFTPANPGSVGVFVLVCLHVVAAFLAAVHHACRSEPAAARRSVILTAAGVAAWVGAVSAFVASGVMSSLPYSGLPHFFGGVLTVSAITGFSRLGGRIASAVPLEALVGFQAFRLPLELVLHRWVSDGTIPESMTWTGQNWDIMSAVVALIAAPFAGQSRSMAWAANIIGGVLLLNVMRVVVLSSPLPFGWKVTPPLQLALHLPYALIGPICVGGALVGHIVLTRALLRPPAAR